MSGPQYGCIDHWIAEQVLDVSWLSLKRSAPVMRPVTKEDPDQTNDPSTVAGPAPAAARSVMRTSLAPPLTP